jgi:hypothetical protein
LRRCEAATTAGSCRSRVEVADCDASEAEVGPPPCRFRQGKREGAHVSTKQPQSFDARRAVEFLEATRLVDLDRPLGDVLSNVSKLADLDGDLICWWHYILIRPGPWQRLEEIRQFERGL